MGENPAVNRTYHRSKHLAGDGVVSGAILSAEDSSPSSYLRECTPHGGRAPSESVTVARDGWTMSVVSSQ